jgi:hypothetical protein
MDAILSGIYGVYMIVQIILIRQLYASLKDSNPQLAKDSSCHMFAMKMIVILHLSLRIVFNSLSDSGAQI